MVFVVKLADRIDGLSELRGELFEQAPLPCRALTHCLPFFYGIDLHFPIKSAIVI